jgi:hypothetical protein
VPIKSVSIHPSFVMGKPAYDIAVLKLATPLNFTSHIKPINLSKVKQKVISAKFMTTYWPRLIVSVCKHYFSCEIATAKLYMANNNKTI